MPRRVGNSLAQKAGVMLPTVKQYSVMCKRRIGGKNHGGHTSILQSRTGEGPPRKRQRGTYASARDRRHAGSRSLAAGFSFTHQMDGQGRERRSEIARSTYSTRAKKRARYREPILSRTLPPRAAALTCLMASRIWSIG